MLVNCRMVGGLYEVEVRGGVGDERVLVGSGCDGI